MDDGVMEALQELASTWAYRYAARCWWADRDDLEQQALLIGLEVVASWTQKPVAEEVNLDYLRGTMWVAMKRQLSRYCWQNSSPVSETQDFLPTLKGVHRKSFHEVAEEVGSMYTTASTPEEDYWLAQAQHLASSRFDEMAGTQVDGMWMLDDAYVGAKRVLLDGDKPAQVAKELGLPTSDVYYATEQVKKRLTRDRVFVEACSVILTRGSS